MKMIETIPENDLERYVTNWINERARDYDDGAKGVIFDLMTGGCVSGYVSELIYTADCRRFVCEFMNDIEELINELIENIGDAEWLVKDHQGNVCFSFDKMAWVGFEETAHHLALKNGIEI